MYFLEVFISMPYLIEPYNAYQKPPRKKHWTEIAEEEALYHKMAQDHMLMERQMQEQIHQQSINNLIAERSALLQMQNLALLSQPTPPSSQQVQDGNEGYPVNAGGSQVSVEAYFPTMFVSFSVSPLTAPGPVTVQFINNSSPSLIQYGSFTWNFGDGTTGTGVSPTHIYANTGSYTASVTASAALSPSVAPVSVSGFISASVPTVTAAFTSSIVTGPAPLTIQFINKSINTSQTPTSTYFWALGSGSATSSAVNPVFTYANPGTYSPSLLITGSYGIANSGSRANYISASYPSLYASFTFVTSSMVHPSVATFTNTTTYNGSGTLTYLWTLGTGSVTSTSLNPNPQTYANAGGYTASLQVTESLFNITSSATATWVIT